MIYRPQFAYDTPEGCRDLDYIYYFDGSNTPLLNQNVSGLDLSAPTGGIPLVTEQDAPFFWRGYKVNALREINNGVPVQYDVPKISVRFKDAYENFLSDDIVPATQSGFASNPWSFNNALLTGPPVPLAAQIYCPPGCTLWGYLKAGTLGSNQFFAQFALYGVKRFKECQ